MIDHVYRAWVIPEKRMILEDLMFTEMLLKYGNAIDAVNGNRKEIGFLAESEGKILDFMLYSSKKDVHGNVVCDKDVIYHTKLNDTLIVKFDGCAFRLFDRGDSFVGVYLHDLNETEIIIMGNIYEGMKRD